MTRLAILADIHGNLPALDAVLKDMAQFRVDHVIVAGDVINWGPFSAQVLERVAQERWAVIRGNNEFYLLDYGTPRAPADWNDRAQYAMLPWLARQLEGPYRNMIAAWPDGLSLRFPDAAPVRVVHGSPRSHTEPIFKTTPEADIVCMLQGVPETTLVCAHTHLTMDRNAGRRHLLNPGSAGWPLDGTFQASYMLMESKDEGWQPVFRRVTFDSTPLFAEYERQGFEAECGVVAQLALAELRTARLQLDPFVRWRKAHHPDAALSPALLAEFFGVDKLAYTPPAYHLNIDGQRR